MAARVAEIDEVNVAAPGAGARWLSADAYHSICDQIRAEASLKASAQARFSSF